MSTRLLAALVLALFAITAGAAGDPVHIGLSAEFGHKTSTSDDAIKAGMEIAIEEINAAGGILGGRPLTLVTRDNRSVPARGVDIVRELAAMKDLVALFCGKFGSVVNETLPLYHELKLPLLDPWAATDSIVDNGFSPNYVFRLSLRDGWAMPFLLQSAETRGLHRIGLLVPNGFWGRSSHEAAVKFIEHGKHNITLVKTAWFNATDMALAGPYEKLLEAGAEAIVFVGNEPEGALLIRDVAALPTAKRLPIFSHWGIAGGNLPQLAGPALTSVDLSVVQTFSFIGSPRPKAATVLRAAMGKLGASTPGGVLSPVGVAHAYDLVHLLALAIDRAGTTDREKIRAALENLGSHDGLIRRYAPPFSSTRHEALTPDLLFLARWRADGALVRAGRP